MSQPDYEWPTYYRVCAGSTVQWAGLGAERARQKETSSSASIVVDGKTTSIGASYLVGPIMTAPLPDGGGTHVITLGVFLAPLSKGTHTVVIKARFDGALILSFLSINFLEEEFMYKVIVQ